jgi:hypothetical protein
VQEHAHVERISFELSRREIELAFASRFQRGFNVRKFRDHARAERIDDLSVEQVHRLTEDLLHTRRGLRRPLGIEDRELVVVRDAGDEEDRAARFHRRRGLRGDLFFELLRECNGIGIELLERLDEETHVLHALERVFEQTRA